MDRDQDDARGFVPRGSAPDLEKWQETNTYWTDYIGKPWVSER
jgi:hypothetical protein